MPEIKINYEKCKGCRLCVSVCPMKSIKISSKTNKKGFPYAEFSVGKCTGCGMCYTMCPDVAIEVYK
jgi:2-oxoglutarate ferredoxin oxidoreductase subunit delta